MSSKLSKLKVKTTSIEVEFPRFPKWKLFMSYAPREEIQELRLQCLKYKFVNRVKEEEVDTDKFMDLYIKRVITGWDGLTMGMVTQLVPLELTDGATEEDSVPYDHADAMWLVKNSQEFDNFVSDTMNQVDLFSSAKKEDQLKK